MDKLGLNERQRMAVGVVKTDGTITNTVYQEVARASRPTAIRDLTNLVVKGVFLRHGVARGVHYSMAPMRLTHDSNDSFRDWKVNESRMTQVTHEGRRKSEKSVGNVPIVPLKPAKSTKRVSLLRPNAATAQVTAPVTAPVAAPVNDYVRRLLDLLESNGALGNADILHAFELKSRRRLRETYIHPALKDGLIEMTIPDKPRSRLQKYQLTPKGRKWLETSRRKP